jgi:ribA/ribD-fused uncharacterized protein
MEENKYTFFWGNHFSQWYPSVFVIDGITYKTAEHYMMWCKAKLFHSERIADMILESDNPDDVRWLGRQIQGFDDTIWKQNCKKFVYDGSYAKFTQNADLLKVLMTTGKTKIVEASPQDFNWGIGLTEEEAKQVPEQKWPGTNWLGEILTQLREDLLVGRSNP